VLLPPRCPSAPSLTHWLRFREPAQFYAFKFTHSGQLNPDVFQVQIGLGNFSGSLANDINPAVRIYSHNSVTDSPNALISATTRTNPGDYGDNQAPGVFTFSLTSAFAAAPGQTFWVILNKGLAANEPGTGEMGLSLQSTPLAAQNESGFSYGGAVTGTLTYEVSDLTNRRLVPDVWNTTSFTVGLTPAIAIVIPEPSAALLGAFGVLGLLRRRS